MWRGKAPTRRRRKKKQIMMAQRAIARVGRKDPLEKSPGDCPETGPDGWPKLAPLEKADWGGAERSWSANGQVRGGLAMLPAGRGRQPGCFQAQTAQAPFVFGSALLGRLMGATPLVWDHSIIQLRVHSQVQLLERPSRRTAPVLSLIHLLPRRRPYAAMPVVVATPEENKKRDNRCA